MYSRTDPANDQQYQPREPLPSAEDRWFLAPRYLHTDEFPVSRLDGLPQRPEATPDDRRAGLMGGLLASSEISRAAALTGTDKPLPPGGSPGHRAPPPRPVDYDPLAAVHFPVTLGRSYGVREQIDADATTAPPVPSNLTFSPPGSGLPYPVDPWKLRTPHNAAEFLPAFRSVGDHLAEAVPAARGATEGAATKGARRERLMAEEAPSTGESGMGQDCFAKVVVLIYYYTRGVV